MARKKILIVDDDPDLSHGLSIRLRANDYDVAVAPDAITAISKVIKEKPNLILLDIGLPGGDGHVVMERLNGKPELAAIPVIVLSARDPVTNRGRALKAGAKAYFMKPVDNQELLAAIDQILE